MIENKRTRKFSGVVASTKMVKTVKVEVEYKTSHPRYKKVLTRKKYYLAHSEMPVQEGDKVVIRECKPYSKNVTWEVVKE